MLRSIYYILTFIYLVIIFLLFGLYYFKIVFIKEEVIEIPEIKSKNKKSFIVPNEIKEDTYNYKILNHADDNLKELDKFKQSDFSNDKKNNILPKDRLDIFVVQLGVFKNKNNADSKLSGLMLNFNDILNGIKLDLYSIKKDKNDFHIVETKPITKEKAINLCNMFKDKKINCIIKIKK